MTIPASLISGDTWSWTGSYGDYPAPTWTAVAYFENASTSFSVTATASGTDHAFAALATATDDYAAGSYYVQVRVTSGASKFTVESGWVEVIADPAAAAATDYRSWARKTLDEVEALILAMATTGIISGSVAGRTYTKHELPKLMQFRNELRAEVRTDEQGDNAGLGRNIKVRYVSA